MPAGKGSKTRRMNISNDKFAVNAKHSGIDTKNSENLNPGKKVYDSKGREILTRRQFMDRFNKGLNCIECGRKNQLLPCNELDKKYKTNFAEKGPFICLECAEKLIKNGKE